MRHMTIVSPVPQRLWSPPWPQRTCGSKSPAILRASPSHRVPSCPVYKPVYRSGSLACADPTRRTRTPADHPVPPAPHSGDPSRGGARISKVLAVTGHAESRGERADLSRQTRTLRVRGSVPAAPASASRPLPVTESYRSIDPDLVPFEPCRIGRVSSTGRVGRPRTSNNRFCVGRELSAAFGRRAGARTRQAVQDPRAPVRSVLPVPGCDRRSDALTSKDSRIRAPGATPTSPGTRQSRKFRSSYVADAGGSVSAAMHAVSRRRI